MNKSIQYVGFREGIGAVVYVAFMVYVKCFSSKFKCEICVCTV